MSFTEKTNFGNRCMIRLRNPSFTFEADALELALSHRGANQVEALLKDKETGFSPVTYGDRLVTGTGQAQECMPGEICFTEDVEYFS